MDYILYYIFQEHNGDNTSKLPISNKNFHMVHLGFGTPYSTVLTINATTQVEPCFVCKKQIV
jgi:hypothetical protein